MERPHIVQPRSKARILRRRLSFLQDKEVRSNFDDAEIASLEAAILLLEWAWGEQHGATNSKPDVLLPGVCPRCESLSVTMSTDYGVRGTGPYGRARLGDNPGQPQPSKCNDCGHVWRTVPGKVTP